MFYVFIFDFALVGLLLCAVAFFVWCWFRQERKPQPVYLQSASAEDKAHKRKQMTVTPSTANQVSIWAARNPEQLYRGEK